MTDSGTDQAMCSKVSERGAADSQHSVKRDLPSTPGNLKRWIEAYDVI